MPLAVQLLALAFALVLDLSAGDPPTRIHPVAAMGTLIRQLTRRWNRGTSTRRLLAGSVLVLLGAALFSLPWILAHTLFNSLPVWIRGVLLGLLLKPVFSFRSLLKAGREVQCALHNDDLEEGRRLVAWHLVSRDTSELSHQEVAAATVESLAENLTDSFLSPLLCFAVGGLPLAWAYRFINTADAMIGYRSEEFEHFGKAAARLDDILNWLPARVTGLLLVLSAGLSGLDIHTAWKTMLAQHNRTSSPNAGWTMAAAAGALGVTLVKRESYSLEGGPSLPQAEDIGRTGGLLRTAAAAGAVLCGLLIAALNSWML
jgi:adenosylcobinamide-phosphate synthase